MYYIRQEYLHPLSNSSNTRLTTLPAFPSPRAFEKASLFNARGLGNAGKVRSRVFERASESYFPKYWYLEIFPKY